MMAWVIHAVLDGSMSTMRDDAQSRCSDLIPEWFGHKFEAGIADASRFRD
jgi:hypothetical protein